MDIVRQLILFSCLPVAALTASPGALETARSTIQEWATAEKAISREAAEWEAQKTLLRDLIAVEAERIERLEGELATYETGLSASHEERAALLDQQEALQVHSAATERFLARIEGDLRDLRPRLPEPLQNDLAAIYARLPGAAASTTLSLGERMQTVVTLLGRVRQFDSRLTVTESIRALPGGMGEASVRTLYLGLAHAYYLAPGDAGIGRVGPEGWIWESRPEFADAIREALLLAEGEALEPKFVDLPVTVEAESEALP
ncbi:MAG: DUF3450 family protein [Opitutales bacterium]